MSQSVFYQRTLRSLVERNPCYRRVLKTYPKHFQIVMMTLTPGETIPRERHPNLMQFFYVMKGRGRVVVGKIYNLIEGSGIAIPLNAPHLVENTSTTAPLHLLTLYSRQEHAPSRRNQRQPRHRRHSM